MYGHHRRTHLGRLALPVIRGILIHGWPRLVTFRKRLPKSEAGRRSRHVRLFRRLARVIAQYQAENPQTTLTDILTVLAVLQNMVADEENVVEGRTG